MENSIMMAIVATLAVLVLFAINLGLTYALSQCKDQNGRLKSVIADQDRLITQLALEYNVLQDWNAHLQHELLTAEQAASQPPVYRFDPSDC